MAPVGRTSKDATRSPSAGRQITSCRFRDSSSFGGVHVRPGVEYGEAPSLLGRSITPREGIGSEEVIWGTQPPLGRIPRALFISSISALFSPRRRPFSRSESTLTETASDARLRPRFRRLSVMSPRGPDLSTPWEHLARIYDHHRSQGMMLPISERSRKSQRDDNWTEK